MGLGVLYYKAITPRGTWRFPAVAAGSRYMQAGDAGELSLLLWGHRSGESAAAEAGYVARC